MVVANDPALPRALEEALDRGAVIAFPTDTVYGLGGDPWSRAVERVRAAKARPTAQPFSLHLPSTIAISRYAAVPRNVATWIDRWLPGPYTVLLHALGTAPPCAVRDGLIGVRVPDHPLFLGTLAALDRPLFGTSANRRGEPPIVSLEGILAEFPEVDLAIVGSASVGRSSSVIDLTTDPARLLRGEMPNGV